jgi:hypothetical protein
MNINMKVNGVPFLAAIGDPGIGSPPVRGWRPQSNDVNPSVPQDHTLEDVSSQRRDLARNRLAGARSHSARRYPTSVSPKWEYFWGEQSSLRTASYYRAPRPSRISRFPGRFFRENDDPPCQKILYGTPASPQTSSPTGHSGDMPAAESQNAGLHDLVVRSRPTRGWVGARRMPTTAKRTRCP